MLNKYIEYMEARRISRKTLNTYLYFIQTFLNVVNKPLEEITLEDVIKFLSSYSNCSYYTQRIVAYALRSYFEVVGTIDYHLIPLPSRMLEDRTPVLIDEATIRIIIKNTPSLKLKTMLALMYELGLRVGELANLTYKDLDTTEWSCYVKRSKGSIASKVPIVSSWVKELIVEYLSKYPPSSLDEPLFKSQKGGKYRVSTLSAIIKNILRMNGFPNAHPHDIRHSRATNLIKKGLEVTAVAKVLGHKSLSSTLRYLHYSIEDLRKKLESLG
jgi:integrase